MTYSGKAFGSNSFRQMTDYLCFVLTPKETKWKADTSHLKRFDCDPDFETHFAKHFKFARVQECDAFKTLKEIRLFTVKEIRLFTVKEICLFTVKEIRLFTVKEICLFTVKEIRLFTVKEIRLFTVKEIRLFTCRTKRFFFLEPVLYEMSFLL